MNTHRNKSTPERDCRCLCGHTHDCKHCGFALPITTDGTGSNTL